MGERKSEEVGTSLGTVEQKRKEFEDKIREKNEFGGGGGKMKLVPTGYQPKPICDRVKKVDTEVIGGRNPEGILNLKKEFRLQDQLIRRRLEGTLNLD